MLVEPLRAPSSDSCMLYELVSAGVEIRRHYFERDAAHFLTTEISLKLAATLGIGRLGGFEESGLTKILAFGRSPVLVLGINALLTHPSLAIAGSCCDGECL